MSVWPSAIALILCIIAFIYFCFRGISPIVVGLCVCAVMAAFSTEGFFTTFFTTLPATVGGSLVSVFFLFIIASILGEIYSVTGFAKKMGGTLVSKVPRWFVPFIIVIVSALFNIIGMPKRDFIIAALAYPLLYAADLPLYIGMVADMGTTTVVSWAMPGIPCLPNLLPAGTFGVEKISYANGMAWPMEIFGLIILIVYILFLVRQADKRNLRYSESGAGLYTMQEDEDAQRTKEPPFILAIIPIILVLGSSLLFTSGFGWDASYGVVVAQFVGIVYLLIAGYKYFPKNKKIMPTIVEAVERMCPVILTVGVVASFCTVVSSTPVYSAIMDWAFNLSVSPYLMIIIIVSVIAGLTSDGIAALLSVGNTDISVRLLATGANPEALAALSRITSAGFDTLPWSANALIPIKIYGLNFKEGYKYMCAVTVILPLVMAFFGMFLSNILYPIA